MHHVPSPIRILRYLYRKHNNNIEAISHCIVIFPLYFFSTYEITKFYSMYRSMMCMYEIVLLHISKFVLTFCEKLILACYLNDLCRLYLHVDSLIVFCILHDGIVGENVVSIVSHRLQRRRCLETEMKISQFVLCR